MNEVDGAPEDVAPDPASSRRRGRRRRHGRTVTRRPRNTWSHLFMASLLLGGLLAFWGQVATGAAACFSSLAPPPVDEGPRVEEGLDTPQPARKRIQIKRVKKSP